MKLRLIRTIPALFAVSVLSFAPFVFAQAPAGPADNEIDEEALAKDASTEINVKNAEIAAIVRIFSKKTRRNFILDERVKGKVSIYLPGRVSEEESVRILDSVLAYKGFAAVPIGQNLWKIVPAKEARTSTIPTLTEPREGPPSPMVVTRLVQLNYVPADEVRQLFSQLISPDGYINAYAATNSLILIDNEDNIARLVEIIENLDVPFSNRDMTIVPVVYAEATDIAQKLGEILGISSSSGSSTPTQTVADFGADFVRARMREMANAAAQAARQGGGNQGGVVPASGASQDQASIGRVQQPKIIADERTNSIIIVADDDTTARVRALISQLDSQVDLSGSRFWVYRCQHANADELADVLSGLVGGGGGRTSTSTGPSEDLISGGIGGGGTNRGSSLSRNRGNQFSRTQNRLRNQSRTPGRSRNESNRTNGQVQSVQFGEDLSITADPATNSLIIFASKDDFQKVKSLLEKLDIKRRQVLVEATLLEVGIDDNRSMDVSWIASTGGADGGILAQNNGSNILNLLSNPQSVQDFSIAAASSGTLTIGGGESAFTIPTQTLLLNAVRANSNVNVLSAPTILTTDNEQAEIVVGQNVPFVSSTATSAENLDNTFNSIERQDVGITLRITPQISSGDSVTLQIFTEVSSVSSSDPRLGPTTSIRTSETSVITKDSQMIVIGGLMSDETNESERGIPYLKDVPVLGHLFKTTIERRRRTNLLILITPRIIQDQFDARDQTIRKRGQLEQEIREFDHYPTREEVLHSMEVDRVSESHLYDGPVPSTIRGEAKTKRARAPIELHLDAPGSSASTDTPASSSSGKLSAEGTLANSPATTSPAALRQDGDIFVVLRLDRNPRIPGAVPFTVTADSLVGVVIPAESRGLGNEFFAPGARRSYSISDQELQFETVDVFASRKEASEKYRSLQSATNWYTLSPYEIMAFGDGPWT